MDLDNLSNLKNNKIFLITILIIGILGLGYVGINLYTASIVPVADTSIRYVKIPAYSQDGSRNMEVILGEPHSLEVYWTSPTERTPPIGYWFYIVNAVTRESYRSPNIPYGTSTYYNIEMTNVSRLDEWTIIYWVEGTNRNVEQYDGIIEGTRFAPFAAYNISREDDYCDETTLYYDGVYNLGEVTFDKEFNSPICGWLPDPCIGVTCQDYCVGTSLYTNGVCSDGVCVNHEVQLDSPTCGFIPDPCLDVVCEDHCVETTSYTNGECIDGICNYDTELNSLNCGYIPDPCLDTFCDDYCDDTTLYNNGECIDGICNYDENLNSSDCGYIAPTPEPAEEDDDEDTILDDIYDLFDSSPSSSSSSSSDPIPTATPTETAAPELVTTEAEDEDTNPISDFLQWIRDLINNVTGI